MEAPLEHLRKRSQDNWLVGHDCQAFLSLAEALFQEFANLVPQKILLAEPDPIRFLAGFIAACSTDHQVFLGNPAWGSSEWQQVFELVKPDIIWEIGDGETGSVGSVWGQGRQGEQGSRGRISQSPVTDRSSPIATHLSPIPNRIIAIPTGGSSGSIRFAMHTWQTLMASVQGFREYFQLTQANSICVLPLYHVSGLMQFMRSFTSGGQLLIIPFKELKTGNWCNFDPTEFFISLVPTQLHCLLSEPNLRAWLSRCRTVLVGGAPTWPELLAKARFYQIKLAPTYGMTETASQIATLKPESFLSGNNSSGQVLPHAKVKISTEVGKFLDSNQTGRIAIQSSSLALGYYPEPFPESGIFYPDDLGFLDVEGNLNIICRSSEKIVTGGENVFPCEVEAVIRATNLVIDVAVIGMPDRYWGQIITAVYLPDNPNISSQQIQLAIEGKLTRFKQPKLWLSVETMPRNEQGKINRKLLQQLVTQWREERSLL
jgi:O-succinylbenzoic acid--CoA ligase